MAVAGDRDQYADCAQADAPASATTLLLAGAPVGTLLVPCGNGSGGKRGWRSTHREETGNCSVACPDAG